MTPPDEPLGKAAQDAARRRAEGEKDPEPSLGVRLGQIGVLGWMIVGPVLLGVFVGRQLDQTLHRGVMFTAAFVCAGAALGLWLAFRWMNRA